MGTKRFKVQIRVLVQTANCSKGFKRHQVINKGLIKEPSSHDSFILMNRRVPNAHHRTEQEEHLSL